MANEKTRGKPQRGVSVYSYAPLLGVSMTLEDCFKDIYDTGATCFELLTSHIENYPNPSKEWVDHYWRLCDKYKLQPAELGHWAESNLRRGDRMSDEEILDELIRDFRLANLLGFTTLRTKITCINEFCDPEPGWEKYIEMALPYAEKYNVRMGSEVHRPTTLKREHVLEYLEFAKKMGTKYFGINVDFGTFQTKPRPALPGYPEQVRPATGPMATILDFSYYSKPEDIIPVLPFCYTCHAKFNYINDDFEETTIPYEEVLGIMLDHGWDGFLVSEYEGPGRDNFEFLSDQLRRHHIMMSRILGY